MLIKSLVTQLFVIYAILFASDNSLSADGADNQLATNCPPGFEQTTAGRCLLRNLYQQYQSLENKGVGGLKTALPAYRDGFTAQQIDLGRYLFFDPILSGDNSISCASCHHPDKGFSDDLDRSIGIHQQKLTRSSPSLWNVGFFSSFFWDGRATTLEQQMQGPLYSPEEMNSTESGMLEKLNNSPLYKQFFASAFTEAEFEIRAPQVYLAIAAFESSLISLNSRYDQYAHGYHKALTDIEIAGLNVFRSFVARCAECHTPPLFTNQQLAVIGTPEADGLEFDIGAEKTYSEPSLKGAFKVPSLRNIAKSAPYMHSGKFKTLDEAVEFYTKGRGHAVPEEQKLIIHWHIWEPDLPDSDLEKLVAFLHTLTDESFKPEIPDRVPSGLTPISHDNYSNKNKNNKIASIIGEQ